GAFLGNGNRTVLGGYRHHCREYSPHHVRPAGSRVVVRGIVERLHRRAHRGIGPGIRIVQLLQCTAGEHGPGTNGVVTGMLLVAPAGHVERHDPPPTLGVLGVDVVPDEQRYGGESGHRGLQVALHHGGQLVGFAVQGQRDTLDLLVVRQLHCVETYQFQGDTRGTRDPDSRILVSNVHLLQIPRRDQIATGGPPVAGDEYTAVERRRNDRRTVRGLEMRRNLPALPATGQQLGRLFPQEISERRRRRRQMSAAERRARGIGSVVHACSCLPICSNGMAVVFSNTGRRQPASRGEEGSLTALLHVCTDEILCVLLKHVVYFIEHRVDVLTHLLPTFLAGRSVLLGVFLVAAAMPLDFFLCHDRLPWWVCYPHRT